MQRYLLATGTALLLLPLALYGTLHFLRPPQTNKEQILFRGITYQRYARSTPRPIMIHVVSVDLTAPGVKALVTPPMASKRDRTSARTTSEFLREFKLQLAVNASYFNAFDEKTPWNYYPHSGDRSYPIGEAISNGDRYAKTKQGWRVLCFSQNRAQILESGKCPEGTTQGVAGSEIFVEHGKPKAQIFRNPRDKPYPRMAVGIDKEGKKLWLIAVDGKQPIYSEGVKMPELAKIVMDLGVDTALNLDGGGSTTVVMATNDGAKVLNAPIHTKIPMRERPVANHLGFYAEPF
ncbi:phosphodiester glycosidase family protein [Fischerella sp. PCC 9605]|uniref:phosphodiester glycosidase family protein n=1 Tax=Fischerella sp. PCC 9605 TaxID=1173024 RepID=UPI00047A4075|nr:phosphodiester glycosidase family protein [Fischerella sp. PCC 9605]